MHRPDGTELTLVAVGAFLLLVGVSNIQQVQRAFKSGAIWGPALSWKPGRIARYDKDNRPAMYWLNFWPSLAAAIFLPIMGLALIGAALFFWLHD